MNAKEIVRKFKDEARERIEREQSRAILEGGLMLYAENGWKVNIFENNVYTLISPEGRRYFADSPKELLNREDEEADFAFDLYRLLAEDRAVFNGEIGRKIFR